MIEHHISLSAKSADPRKRIEPLLRDMGLTLGEETTGAEKGIYTWQINTPEGTPLEKLQIGFDENQNQFMLDDGENTQRDAEPKTLLRSIRLSPTVGLKDPAI